MDLVFINLLDFHFKNIFIYFSFQTVFVNFTNRVSQPNWYRIQVFGVLNFPLKGTTSPYGLALGPRPHLLLFLSIHFRKRSHFITFKYTQKEKRDRIMKNSGFDNNNETGLGQDNPIPITSHLRRIFSHSHPKP